jgi:hypothetical protein
MSTPAAASNDMMTEARLKTLLLTAGVVMALLL